MPALIALSRFAALAAALAFPACSALAQTSAPPAAKPAPTQIKSATRPAIKPAAAAPKTKDAAQAAKTQATKPNAAKAREHASTITRIARTPRQSPNVQAGAAAPGDVKALVSAYAQRHGVPEALAHRIVLRESRYNPAAAGRAQFGLMQISLPTARSMGYTGAPQGLLDARTNLTYGMPYLANAWIVSGGSEAHAQSLYTRGYYNDAKRKGLTRNLRNARSAPVEIEDAEDVAAAQ